MVYSKILTAFLLCSVFCSISADERGIFVSPSGNDSSNCSEVAKCTLDRALWLASGLNSTIVFASKGNYSLKTSHNFTRVSSFGVFGNGSRDDVQITCEPNVSLSFTLSENITLEGVKFQKCGGWHQSSVGAKKNYPDLKGARFKTALDFRYCRNLRMSNVEISSSPGLGANLYDVGGVVSFTDCLFADNYASNENINVRWEYQTESGRYIYSGGGVYLILNRYGYDTLNVTRSEHDSYQHNNTYEFTNCTFFHNKALWLNATKENELNTPELPFSRGGGLAVFFRGNASGCLVKIQSCDFTGNKASWGGGLQVEMNDKTEMNSLIVEASNFKKNFASLCGGGARLGSVPFKAVQLHINRFILINCSFVNNTAIWGGGTSLYGTTIPRKCIKHTNPNVIQFFFHGCRWRKNEGNIGAAMVAYLYNRNEDLIGPEIPYRVCFQNDTFYSNKVVLLHDYLTTGQGTLYSVQVPLIFRGDVQFINNTQSALVLDGSTMEVHDRLDFFNNIGTFKGGAIAMYGRSRIILSANTSSLTFKGNKCGEKGGALYIEAPGPPLVSFNATESYNQACFFGYSDPSKDYDKWNTSVIFKNNNASLGKSVYATTLKNCRRVGESRQHNSVLKWNFVKFENRSQNLNSSLSGEVATDPVELQHNKEDWQVAPGEVFNAIVKLLDEVGNHIPGIVKVSIETSSVLLNNHSPLFLATDGQIRHISLRGENGSVFSVGLRYVGNQFLEKLIDNVTLKDCYAGFIFYKNSCECMTSTNDEWGRGVSHCGSDNKTVFVKEGYWAGNVNGTFATYFCPIGYCNQSSNGVNNSYQYFEGRVCNESRNQKSILCGECKDNYTISIGSERCVKNCTYWHLVYLLPFGLGFPLIVIIVMLIDLDFFTGYLNAWLYAYQIMKLLTPDGFEFDPFIEFVIAFTNVRIQIGDHSFCLAKDLDDADKLVLEYAIPVYVLLIVGLLTWLIRRYPNWCFSRKVLRSTPSAPFRAVCTILVFCYTDITGISLKILHPAKVGPKTVLYDQGGLDFFHGKHLGYGIFAIICIVVFVVPFPLILLFRPFLTRGLRPVLNLNRWTPFFDAFQSCFKDQYRWCAAFYFLCRLGILLLHTYLPASSTKRVVLEVACILILVIFASLRPYKEAGDVNQDESSYEWINISDVALLTTLSFIAVISSPIECATTSVQGLKVVVKILAYVPLVVLLVLGYRVLRNYFPVIDIRNWLHQDIETTPIMSETTDVHSSPKGTPEVSITQSGSIGSPGGAPQPTAGQHSSQGSHDS